MVGTRSTIEESQRRFQHIMTEKLGLEIHSPIYQALSQENVNTLSDLATLSDKDIEEMEYTITMEDDEGQITTTRLKISKGNRGWIRSLIAFIKYYHMQSEEEFENVTLEEFNTFRLSKYDPDISSHTAPPIAQSQPPKRKKNDNTSSLLAFKKNIKRDKNQYTTLREDRQWDSWNRSTKAIARTHDCEDVFNETYLPTDDEQKDLFLEKQIFIYSVFEEKIQTNMGRYLVRKYERTYDAQSIYVELCEYSKTSTQANIQASNILSYITTVKLHKIAWKGTYHSFILHWVNKLRLYEDMVPIEDHFTDSVKKTMLENTVVGVTSLKSVKNQADHDKAHGRGTLSYDNYLTLLLSAAAVHDAEYSFKHRGKSSIYNINQHHAFNTYYESDEHDIDSDFVFENNTQELYQAYQRPPFNAPRMSREKWINLSRQEQQAWDTMSNRSKAIILGISSPQQDKRRNEDANTNNSKNENQKSINHSESNSKSPSEGILTTSEDNQEEYQMNKESITTFLTNQNHPGDLRNLLSSSMASDNNTSTNDNQLRDINVSISYMVSKSNMEYKGSLVDRGANGGLAGNDVRVICKHNPPRYIDVSGLDSHQVKDLEIITAGGVAPSQKGPVIIILHQYAHLGKGSTIHSCIQLEAFKNNVDDKSIHHKGSQTITTNDGYIHPLDFINGLPYLPLRPYTDKEWETLPHVVWTSDMKWDPSVIDHKITDNNEWGDYHNDQGFTNNENPFDICGEYIGTFEGNQHNILDINKTELTINQHYLRNEQHLSSFGANINMKIPKYKTLQPYLLYVDDETIKETIDATTQYGRTNHNNHQLRQTFKSPFPAMNVFRRNEPVATDTVYSSVPAVDDGSKLAQIYVGRLSLVIDVYPIKNEKEFVHTLQENIRKRGAMDTLISDRAKIEISRQCHDILRAYCIKDWQSEPHYQHQNFAERKYAQIKPLVNRLLNTTGAPPEIWLLALQHVTRTLNHLANKSIDWKTPIQVLSGSKPDITSIIIYKFWEKVYYKRINPVFPSDSNEMLGRFVGVSDTVGHALTYKILSKENKILFRSRIRSAENTTIKNKILEPSQQKEFVRSKFDRVNELPTISPDDLIGRTYLREPSSDGTRLRAKIVEKIMSDDRERTSDPRYIKFRCTVNNGEFEDIVTYIDIINHIERKEDEDTGWKFSSITDHQGPLSKGDKDYKGSRFNVLVNWDSGESTYEPLDLIGKDDPITCALYGKKHNLLNLPGWKRFKRIIDREKDYTRIINKTDLPKTQQSTDIVPRNHQHAMDIDRKAGNDKWLQAEQTELKQIHEYDTFIDMGKGTVMPSEFTKIRVHFVYAIKHDGRYKARLVAGGHLTKPPDGSIYSGVVSLKGIRIVIFLGELNNMPIYSTDIGNAYLEAKTQEKVYIIAGHEFGPLEGHTLVINKALYGLRSSGLRWHEHLADSLREMGFYNTKAENDIWMKRGLDSYEYIASYVDDLCIVAYHPEQIINHLEKVTKYKLKGTGPITHHLGCDYFRDTHHILCYAPKQYVEKLIRDYNDMFGQNPKQYWSPLEANDHPEIDNTKELDQYGIKQYQSMIGSLQWAVSLGRLDISTAVMTLSSFRSSPREGHMNRVKRIYGYLYKFKHSAIRIRTGHPNLSNLPRNEYNWENSVYGNVYEIQPDDAPPPLGNPVTLTTYVDANLYHDMITGRSVTGVLHMINQTPFDWYSKKQNTVETATYGSEFTAARIAVDQIITNRNMLRYLGVPIKGSTHMFGDNRSVIDSSNIPQAKLHKRHNALSFHRVREAIAAKIISFIFIPGNINPADILSKHWGHQQVKTALKTLLFYVGDTANLFAEEKL